MFMGSKASAVIYGEGKNSTQLDRFQLSWDPGQLQSRRGRRWRRRKESLNNNYAWSIMQRAVKRRCFTLSSVESMTRMLILCMTSSPTGKRAHAWTLGQESKKNSFWESACKWAFHEDQLLIQHWRRGYPWGPGTHFLIEGASPTGCLHLMPNGDFLPYSRDSGMNGNSGQEIVRMYEW